MTRVYRLLRSKLSLNFVICFMVGAITGAVILVAIEYYIRPDIWSYSGDGDIDFLFVRDPPLLPPGYQLDFGAFDPAHEFSGTYKIRNLPQRDPTFGLRMLTLNTHAFDADPASVRRYGPNVPTGELAMKLLRKDGETIFDVRKPISDWIASTEGSSRSGLREFKLYYMENDGSTAPDQSELQSECTLEVVYKPGEKPVAGLAIVALWSGGHL